MTHYGQAERISGVMGLMREDTRRVVAYVVIASYLVLMSTIVLVGWMILGLNTDEVLKVLTTSAGVLGGVVGAVVGFYFQSRK